MSDLVSEETADLQKRLHGVEGFKDTKVYVKVYGL